MMANLGRAAIGIGLCRSTANRMSGGSRRPLDRRTRGAVVMARPDASASKTSCPVGCNDDRVVAGAHATSQKLSSGSAK